MNQPSASGASPAKTAVLRILSGPSKGRQFRLFQNITIGSASSCDVVLSNSRGCSPEHALIACSESECSIKSLDRENPVLINKKPELLWQLRPNDVISIGKTDFLFVGWKARRPKKTAPQGFNLPKKKSAPLSPARILFAGILLAMGYVYLSDQKKPAAEKKTLKTEEELSKELEGLGKLTDETEEEKHMSSGEEAAQTAFIRGFRDYRKGFFRRALKQFEHCSTLFRGHDLCRSYAQKSKINLEKLIQQKIILGKQRRTNKQYEKCAAIFKSVEIMIQDASSPVYKEARENRRHCLAKTQNKI